jgi:hypothetical protein
MELTSPSLERRNKWELYSCRRIYLNPEAHESIEEESWRIKRIKAKRQKSARLLFSCPKATEQSASLLMVQFNLSQQSLLVTDCYIWSVLRWKENLGTPRHEDGT